jgi:hypothetical protein
MRSCRVGVLPSTLFLTLFTACQDPSSRSPDVGEPTDEPTHIHEGCVHEVPPDPVEPPLVDHPAVADVSVADRDRPTRAIALGDPTLPVEAKLLVLSANGTEPELAAIKSVLRHRGVPFDVFVASTEPSLTSSRLRTSSGGGAYQGTILCSNSLSVSGTSQLSSSEWTVLADYEQEFAVRRAVLASNADPAMGWGSYSTQSTSSSSLSVTCSSAGRAVFRDVNCDVTQKISGGTVYLSTPASSSLTPLLRDSAGHALAAIHTGSDGRESLLLLSRQDAGRVHSQQFLHGVLNWVTYGTWLGERRIDMGLQIDDIFLASDSYDGGTYRITAADWQANLDWQAWRRTQPSTPDFQMTMAYNGLRATDGDPLTEAIRATSEEWDWVTHTYNHHHLDDKDYAFALNEFVSNIEVAEDLPLLRFDPQSFVPPNISGLVNREVMQAAVDVGIRYAVTDTSKDGCDNPSPNMAFYNRLQPSMLLIPRRPGGIPYHVSSADEWLLYYNDTESGTYTYDDVIEDKSDMLFTYMMRGEADPWMYHQSNLRAYDGDRPLIADLIDEVVDKIQEKLRVPMRTPDMLENGKRFARRINFEGAGVRATLYRGRALVIDAGRTVTFPVTGVRPEDGESYGGDEIMMVTVNPGTSTCIPLDAAGAGCSPSPGRSGGAGTVTPLPTDYCDGTGDAGIPADNVVIAIPRGSTWRFWDQGGLGTSWRARTFDDSGWAQGQGPLGYGETYVRTTVSYGSSSSNKHTTTYVRKTFNVSDPSVVTGMIGKVMYDDGFVAYLNGTEIGRASMPTGTVSSTTFATGHEASNSYTQFDWDSARSLLVAGSNTLAIEVHQSDLSSSDLVIDAELQLEVPDAPPPPPPPPPPPSGGVPRESAWWYWDNGGDLGSAWRTQTTGGSGWDNGRGVLGYGESYVDTTVSYGPSSSSKHTTTYFTTTFDVEDASDVTSMVAEVMYDDGFIAYLNGTEIARGHMPTGAVNASTFSLGHEANNTYVTVDVSGLRGLLRDGSNTLAVEVHQVDLSSSDLVFDMGLVLGVDEPPPPPPPPPPSGGVPRESAWWYWDNGGDLGSAWRTQTTGGSGWDLGAGVLGYGESYVDTTVSYGPSSSSKYITTYFTTTFDVEDASDVTSMVAEVMYDDGFIAYLNGTEIARGDMPTGAVNASTFSLGHEANNTYVTVDVSGLRGLLRDGSNTLAVEVHQVDLSSSDLVFDMGLVLGVGEPPPPPPPPPASGGFGKESTWFYWDNGGDLGSAWRTQTSGGSGWDLGAGVLGYGSSSVDTTVSYGPSSSSKYVTTYFTKTFTVDDASAIGSVVADVLYDDGFVVYLNGTEVARASMPGGTVTASTLAMGHDSYGGYEAFDWSAWRGLLRDGDNVIAVEVHQVAASSSDLVFDLELVLEGGGGEPPPPPATGGFPRESTWFYWDNGGDLGTSWRTQTGGSGWDAGAGVLGYGHSYIDTTVSYGPSSSSKYITTYFTRAFSVENAASVTSLLADVMYDDGFVVYVNGLEVARASMPSGSVTASTLAAGHESAGEYESFRWLLPSGLLRDGQNVIAVEVHQSAASSSDLVFDLALELE